MTNQNSLSSNIEEFKKQFIKTPEFAEIVNDKIKELGEWEQDEPLPWKMRLVHKDKHGIKFLEDYIDEARREIFKLDDDIDRKYQKSVGADENLRQWLAWSIERDKGRKAEIQMRVRNCENKIAISKGKFKDKPLDIARAKAVPIGEIADAVWEGTKERKKCNCPIHNEKTPSFVWYVRENRGKCFGCGWWGDSIDLYMKLNDCDFVSAVTALNKY